MKERRLDILGVCETRKEGNGRMIMHENYQMMWSGLPNEKMHGVAMIIMDVDYVNERIMKVTLQLKNLKITIMQVYAPQQGRPAQEKEDFLGEFCKIQQNRWETLKM